MSRPVVSSDLHLGHKGICKYRPFETPDEHHWAVFNAHKGTIKKNDTWYCLGDCAFTREWLYRLQEINCRRKVLLLGNHDLEGDVTMEDLLEVFDDVQSLKAHKCFGTKIWLSHCPIHPDELRNKDVNIHGHTHFHVLDDYRFVNTCVEYTNWGVVPLEDVIEKHKGHKEIILSLSWFRKLKRYVLSGINQYKDMN